LYLAVVIGHFIGSLEERKTSSKSDKGHKFRLCTPLFRKEYIEELSFGKVHLEKMGVSLVICVFICENFASDVCHNVSVDKFGFRFEVSLAAAAKYNNTAETRNYQKINNGSINNLLVHQFNWNVRM